MIAAQLRRMWNKQTFRKRHGNTRFARKGHPTARNVNTGRAFALLSPAPRGGVGAHGWGLSDGQFDALSSITIKDKTLTDDFCLRRPAPGRLEQNATHSKAFFSWACTGQDSPPPSDWPQSFLASAAVCEREGMLFTARIIRLMSNDRTQIHTHKKRLTKRAVFVPCAVHGSIRLHLQIVSMLTVQPGNDAL